MSDTVMTKNPGLHSDAPTQGRRREVEVIVKAMPLPPSKPLFQDPTRLISIAAFLLSLITGAFTMYSTWKAETDSTVDDVGKLIGAYYENAEKLKTINPWTEVQYFNLVRTQQRSQAEQAVSKALRVSRHLNVGIWMSLAQINSYEQNCPVADQAWRAATQNSTDIISYLFSLRGKATNDGWCFAKLEDAVKHLQVALVAVRANEIKEPRAITNYLTPQQRSMEIANIHVVWLALFPPTDCSVLVPHYDAALAAYADAFNGVSTEDKSIQKSISDSRMTLDQLRDAREACRKS